MSDNATTPVPDGTKFGFDECVVNAIAVLVALNKIGFGADGVYTGVDANNPLPVAQDGVATETKQDAAIAAINGLKGPDYQAIGAGQADIGLGAAGAAGDMLSGLIVTPLTTSPGAISIKDNGAGEIVLFAGGADSISTLHPFPIPFGALSAAGAWSITVGANVSVVAVGKFS